jgi:hypothetical protein
VITTCDDIRIEIARNGFKNIVDGWWMQLLEAKHVLGIVPLDGSLQFYASGQRMSLERSHAGKVIEDGICDTFMLKNKNGMWVKGSVGSDTEDVDLRFHYTDLTKGNPIWIDTMTLWTDRG